MKICRMVFSISLLSLVAAAAAAIDQAPDADAKHSTDLAVIVNVENPINDVRLSELRKIVVGEQRSWKGRLSIELILRQDNSAEQQVILRTLAQMDAPEFHKHWAAKVFRGEAAAEPLTVPSSGLASEYVSTHKGAVGFVRGTDLRKDLKVIKVDGFLPGTSGYPLH